MCREGTGEHVWGGNRGTCVGREQGNMCREGTGEYV